MNVMLLLTALLQSAVKKTSTIGYAQCSDYLLLQNSQLSQITYNKGKNDVNEFDDVCDANRECENDNSDNDDNENEQDDDEDNQENDDDEEEGYDNNASNSVLF